MDEFLSASDIEALTHYKQHGKQVEFLTANGIPHQDTTRGLKISRYHVRQWLEGKRQVCGEPNMEAIA